MKKSAMAALRSLKNFAQRQMRPLTPPNTKRCVKLSGGSEVLLKTKSTIPALVKLMGLRGEGVEVGVQTGSFSELILNVTELKKLYSVDPWKHYDESIYIDDSANVDQDAQEALYQQAVDRLKKYADRSHILRMESIAAAKLFMNEQLDFIFIDANHSYDAVKEDIEAWWPKIKKGGVFSGDDYLFTPKGKTPVKDAVDEFIAEKKQTLYLTCNRWPRWLVIKE